MPTNDIQNLRVQGFQARPVREQYFGIDPAISGFQGGGRGGFQFEEQDVYQSPIPPDPVFLNPFPANGLDDVGGGVSIASQLQTERLRTNALNRDRNFYNKLIGLDPTTASAAMLALQQAMRNRQTNKRFDDIRNNALSVETRKILKSKRSEGLNQAKASLGKLIDPAVAEYINRRGGMDSFFRKHQNPNTGAIDFNSAQDELKQIAQLPQVSKKINASRIEAIKGKQKKIEKRIEGLTDVIRGLNGLTEGEALTEDHMRDPSVAQHFHQIQALQNELLDLNRQMRGLGGEKTSGTFDTKGLEKFVRKSATQDAGGLPGTTPESQPGPKTEQPKEDGAVVGTLNAALDVANRLSSAAQEDVAPPVALRRFESLSDHVVQMVNAKQMPPKEGLDFLKRAQQGIQNPEIRAMTEDIVDESLRALESVAAEFFTTEPLEKEEARLEDIRQRVERGEITPQQGQAETKTVPPFTGDKPRTFLNDIFDSVVGELASRGATPKQGRLVPQVRAEVVSPEDVQRLRDINNQNRLDGAKSVGQISFPETVTSPRMRAQIQSGYVIGSNSIQSEIGASQIENVIRIEGGFDPDVASGKKRRVFTRKDGSISRDGVGVMQIKEEAFLDTPQGKDFIENYNKKHGTTHSMADKAAIMRDEKARKAIAAELRNPEMNVAVGIQYLDKLRGDINEVHPEFSEDQKNLLMYAAYNRGRSLGRGALRKHKEFHRVFNSFSPEGRRYAAMVESGSRNIRYGKRIDGTQKGTGWFGVLKNSDGQWATEVTMGVEFDGKEMQIPTLVPTLSRKEIEHVLTGQLEILNERTRQIEKKAIEFAKKRLKQNKSPFIEPDEKPKRAF